MKSLEHAQARNLFFQTDLTQTEIANLIGISGKTLSLWAKEGQWRKLKRLANQAPSVMINEMYDELSRINQTIKSREPGSQFATRAEAEIRRKILASIKYIQTQVSPNAHSESLLNFTEFVLARNLDHAQILTNYADRFLKGEKTFGSKEPKYYDLSDLPDEDIDDTPAPPLPPQA
jgi:uncharacterized protein YjcR